MPYLAIAFLTLLLFVPAAPAAAQEQAEVYASGMRNPYRWSFDRQTGDMYVGDVGGTREEITFIPAAQTRGANLGWNCWSGTVHVDMGCNPANYFPPTYDYPSGPDVVIGGYLVRDTDLPSFAGQYLFGRFDPGIIMKLGPQAALPATDTGLDVANVSGFGEDGLGHLYATSLAGEVYRLGESGGMLTKTSIGSFNSPVAVAAPPGDPNQLFIVEKAGRVQLRTPAGTTEFLNLSAQVQDGGEQGLLALAVAPDYATSHRVFVFYNDNGGDLQLDEYRDGVRTPLITIQHDQADNHNGGQLLFGPDGGLYLSTGDGGTQGDPEGDAQNPNSLLGKILRFDVGAGSTAHRLGRHDAAGGLGACPPAPARAAPARRCGLLSLQRDLRGHGGWDAADRQAQAAPAAGRRIRAALAAHASQGPAQEALGAPAPARARRRPPAPGASPAARARCRGQPIGPGPPLAFAYAQASGGRAQGPRC